MVSSAPRGLEIVKLLPCYTEFYLYNNHPQMKKLLEMDSSGLRATCSIECAALKGEQLIMSEPFWLSQLGGVTGI